jgi:transposase-like protein
VAGGGDGSATSCTRANLDDRLTKFAQRRVTEAYRYLILDASYEEVRDGDL